MPKSLIEMQRDSYQAPDTILSYTTETSCPVMDIQYVGSEASCTVEVAAGGDMTIKIGDLGSEAGDANIGASGVIDLSTPAAGFDTFGELADYLNSKKDYNCMLHAHPDDSTDNTINTLSATQAKYPNKASCLLDGAVAKHHIYSISQRLFPPPKSGLVSGLRVDDDEQGHINILKAVNFIGTNASNWAPYMYVYNIKGRTVDGNIYKRPFTGVASTETFAWPLTAQGDPSEIKSMPGYRLLVKILNSTNWFTAIGGEHCVGSRA